MLLTEDSSWLAIVAEEAFAGTRIAVVGSIGKAVLSFDTAFTPGHKVHKEMPLLSILSRFLWFAP